MDEEAGVGVTWADKYRFDEPMEDLRGSDAECAGLRTELLREVGPGHVLHGRDVAVIARALPDDDIVVVSGLDVLIVHLTWNQRTERAPWPQAEVVGSAEEFEARVRKRYGEWS